MENEFIITEKTTVHEAIKKYPALKDTFISISDRYKKLNNPLVFNTAAKITTMESAAKIGGVYVREFLLRLNRAIGKEKKYLEYVGNKIPKMQKEFLRKNTGKKESKGRGKPGWMEKSGKFGEIDARKTEEPFSIIMEKAANTPKGSGFVLIQEFEPAPVIENLSRRGFEYYTDRISDNETRVYFYKP